MSDVKTRDSEDPAIGRSRPCRQAATACAPPADTSKSVAFTCGSVGATIFDKSKIDKSMAEELDWRHDDGSCSRTPPLQRDGRMQPDARARLARDRHPPLGGPA